MSAAPGGPRLTVIFHRLGPYHVARLNALAPLCRLDVVELTASDRVYAWEPVRAGHAFPRTTLFDDLDRDRGQRRALPGALRRALDAADPDCVAAPGWGFPGALAALDWGLARRRPVVLFSDSQAHDYPRRGLQEALKSRLVGLFTGALVAGRSAAEYVHSLGMPRERIHDGYDVVDNRFFAEGAAAARADAAAQRARLGLPERYFLASSRFVPQKNLATLLRGHALAAQRDRRVPDLVVVGDGPLRPDLEALLASLGTQGRVRLPGFLQYPDLPTLYGLAEAFVHAPTMEPWGLVVNEAMAAGLPVAVSRVCGCVPDLIGHGRNGYVLDPTPEGVAAALQELAGLGPQRRAALGRAAQETIAAWGPERFADNLLKAAGLGPEPARPRLAGRLLAKVLVRTL